MKYTYKIDDTDLHNISYAIGYLGAIQRQSQEEGSTKRAESIKKIITNLRRISKNALEQIKHGGAI